MQQFEIDYANLVQDILDNGIERKTRNAVTKSVFGRTLRINLQDNEFPILIGRKMFYKGVVGELGAFLKGPKTLKDFEDQGCNYWKQWAKPDGSIAVDYGNAWLDFNGVNQLEELVKGLKADPYGRRHIVSGWRPDRLKELSLPCCHLLYQWYVRDGKLDMVWYQRSVDTMIGLPSDIILAYLWNVLISAEVGLEPGEIIMMLGDTHIYEPHYENAKLYISNVNEIKEVSNINNNDMTPRFSFITPNAVFCKWNMKDFDPKAFNIYDYFPYPQIQFELLA